MENREIDKLIAEKVMGWETEPFGPFFPSTNIQDAWSVVEKLNFDVKVTKYKDSGYQCHVFIPSNVQMVFAESAPMAICKAALKAVGIEIKKE